MTARQMIRLIGKACLVRHPDGTTTTGVLEDARIAYGELRCDVSVDVMAPYGEVRRDVLTFAGSRVWLEHPAEAGRYATAAAVMAWRE